MKYRLKNERDTKFEIILYALMMILGAVINNAILISVLGEDFAGILLFSVLIVGSVGAGMIIAIFLIYFVKSYTIVEREKLNKFKENLKEEHDGQ